MDDCDRLTLLEEDISQELTKERISAVMIHLRNDPEYPNLLRRYNQIGREDGESPLAFLNTITAHLLDKPEHPASLALAPLRAKLRTSISAALTIDPSRK